MNNWIEEELLAYIDTLLSHYKVIDTAALGMTAATAAEAIKDYIVTNAAKWQSSGDTPYDGPKTLSELARTPLPNIYDKPTQTNGSDDGCKKEPRLGYSMMKGQFVDMTKPARPEMIEIPEQNASWADWAKSARQAFRAINYLLTKETNA